MSSHLEFRQFSLTMNEQPLMASWNHISTHRVLQIVGKNGSGKTLLANLLAGMEIPYQGQILHDFKPEEIELVSQAYLRMFLMPTVELELAFPMQNRNLSHDHIQKRLNQIQTQFELHDIWHKEPFSLSVGERHKVALLAAFFGGARCLILDEPFAFLDAQQHQLLEQWLTMIGHVEKIIIFSLQSHWSWGDIWQL